MFDYAARRRKLDERMDAEGVDLLFLTQSADLEYLTGVERDIPNFGEASYAHGWVAGAFFRPGAEPVFVFPRMFVAFHLRDQLPAGEVVTVNETDDGPAIFERVARGLGSPSRSATGSGSRRPSTSRRPSAPTACAPAPRW
jgi:Xaa-Pro aminopeptidase